MASAVSGRVERNMRGGEAFGRAAHGALPHDAMGAELRVQMARAAAPPRIDVFRLVVAAAGLSAGVILPAALVLWAASDVLARFGARVLAMLH